MREFWALFHKLWGQCKQGIYDKKSWKEFHNFLLDLLGYRK